MKFMMTGAITLATLDGANIEIKDEVGDENVVIFGMDKDEVMNTMHVTITTLVQFMKITQSFAVSLIPLLTVRFQMLKLKVLKFTKPSSPTTMSTSSWKTSLLM